MAVAFTGEADVIVGTSYDGEESLGVYPWLGPNPAPMTDWVTSNFGAALCEYTWSNVTGTPHTSSDCEDDFGNDCEFAFDLNVAGVGQSAGSTQVCNTLFPTAPVDGTFGYGVHAQFYYDAGYAYDLGGPWLLYNATGTSYWTPGTSAVTWNPSSGSLEYVWITSLAYY